ncbi:MAG: hypothetical protein Q9177_005284 [Variospora cf. flavescens]
MADKQNETASAEQVNEQSEVSRERVEYFTRIMEELKVAFSAAVAGEYMRVNGNDTVMPPAELRSLRDRLQSLREDLMAAFESEGRTRKLLTDTPTGHVFHFSSFPFPAEMLQRVRNVRDSKSAYGQIAGFCVISVCQIFFEQAQPWAAIAAKYVEDCWSVTRAFIVSILLRLAPAKVSTAMMDAIVDTLLNTLFLECEQRLEAVLVPSSDGFPLLSDPVVVDRIHDTRHAFAVNETKVRLHEYVMALSPQMNNGNHVLGSLGGINVPIVPEHLAEFLTARTKAQADNRACVEMLCCVRRLWQDAAVDLQRDVAIQCIELGLLARLNAILSPDLITSADPQALNDIEVELPEARVERLKEHDKLASKDSHSGLSTPTISSPASVQAIESSQKGVLRTSHIQDSTPATKLPLDGNSAAPSAGSSAGVKSLSSVKPEADRDPNTPENSRIGQPASGSTPAQQSISRLGVFAQTSKGAPGAFKPPSGPFSPTFGFPLANPTSPFPVNAPVTQSSAVRSPPSFGSTTQIIKPASPDSNSSWDSFIQAVNRQSNNQKETQSSIFGSAACRFPASVPFPAAKSNSTTTSNLFTHTSTNKPCNPPSSTLFPPFIKQTPPSTLFSTSSPDSPAFPPSGITQVAWDSCPGSSMSSALVAPIRETTKSDPDDFQMVYYQSMCVNPFYGMFSPEEYRVADYKAWRKCPPIGGR